MARIIALWPEKTLNRSFCSALIVLIAGLCALYVYFVQLSIFDINERRISENKIGQLEGQIAALETEYLNLANQRINLEYASALGFKGVRESDRLFVTRGYPTVSLSSI